MVPARRARRRPWPQLREVVKPLDSIKIPSRIYPLGYLENTGYSPGRMVPKGVEIVEPGGVSVTITHTTGPT